MGTIEGPLWKIIAALREFQEQYGPGATLAIDYGYDTSDQLYLVFESHETEEEYAARRRERQKKKKAEYNQYLKLKAKFETQEDA